jgi:hypothetical protein
VKPKLWFHLVRHNCVSNAWSLTRLTLMANGCWACAVSIRRAAIGFRLDTSLMANRRLLSLSLASAASVALRPLTSSEPTSFKDRAVAVVRSHEHGVPVHGDHAAEIVHTKKHLPLAPATSLRLAATSTSATLALSPHLDTAFL